MYCWNFNFENSVILEVLIFNCRSYLELSQVGSKFRVLTSYPYHTQFTKTEGITDKKLCIYQFTQRALTEHLQRTDNFPNDESYLHVTFTFSSKLLHRWAHCYVIHRKGHLYVTPSSVQGFCWSHSLSLCLASVATSSIETGSTVSEHCCSSPKSFLWRLLAHHFYLWILSILHIYISILKYHTS